jgi:hypothetical protein
MNAKVGNRDYEYPVNLVYSICCLAGVPSYVDDLRADLRDNGRCRGWRPRALD